MLVFLDCLSQKFSVFGFGAFLRQGLAVSTYGSVSRLCVWNRIFRPSTYHRYQLQSFQLLLLLSCPPIQLSRSPIFLRLNRFMAYLPPMWKSPSPRLGPHIPAGFSQIFTVALLNFLVGFAALQFFDSRFRSIPQAEPISFYLRFRVSSPRVGTAYSDRLLLVIASVILSATTPVILAAKPALPFADILAGG